MASYKIRCRFFDKTPREEKGGYQGSWFDIYLTLSQRSMSREQLAELVASRQQQSDNDGLSFEFQLVCVRKSKRKVK